MINSNFKILEVMRSTGSYEIILKEKCVKVNKSILSLLGFPHYVNVLLDAEGKCLAFEVVSKPTMYSLDFSTTKSIKDISSPAVIGTVRTLMKEWDNHVDYKVRGTYDANEKIMYFDLTEARVFHSPVKK